MSLENLQKLGKPSSSIGSTGQDQGHTKIPQPGVRDQVWGKPDLSVRKDRDNISPVTGLSASAGDAPADNAPKADPPIEPMERGDLKALIQRLLVSAGLGSCYEPAPDMPMGYCMGFPKDGPLDLKENAQSRQAAWWVLAMASGQFDPGLCRSHLEDSNEWRTLVLEESNQEMLGGLELAIQHNIGGQGEFLPIPWLLNQDNPTAGVCLELLAAIRGGVKP
jgi:hypothetical protein